MDGNRNGLILEVISEGYWDWDLKSDRAYLSPRYCELVGYSPEDTIFDSHFFESIIHPDDRAYVFKTIDEHLQGKSCISVVRYRMISKSGAVRWVEGKGKIVEYDGQGAPARMVGTINDITAQKQAENALRESEEFTSDVLDSLTSHVAVLDPSGIITMVNESWRQFARENRDTVEIPGDVGTQYLDVCRDCLDRGDDESAEAALVGIRTVLQGEQDQFSMEYPCHSPDEQRWFTMDVTVMKGAKRGVVIAHTDITARKQAEEALRKSEERYRGLVEQMGEGLGGTDSSFVMTFANSRFFEIMGLTADQVVGKNLLALFGDENRNILQEQLSIRRGGCSSSYELAVTRNDGTLSYLVIKATPHLDQDGQYAGSIALLTDVTYRKVAEIELRDSHERLRQLSAHMETAREDERLKISREVHDELGQSLTALKFDIAFLRKNDSFPPNLALKLASMEETLDATIGFVQRIVAQLRPRLLDDLGLEAAIEWQASSFTERTGIACRLELCESPVLAPECSIAVIRILQEALTNIMRHANATEVTIVLAREDDGLVFTITDNGIGFSKPEPEAVETFGLMGMNERALLCGGTLAISSTQGQGTVIRLHIPLNKVRT